ncbi:ribonuclease J [Anoxybacter fermentans]|uniref:Ribonuclease J n=1 Tax=Anoxybacter fermentans TaxID=1323375 RepID=A0A3Q9HSE9_9FIRM|nr:ribonuclease J [Anoxybacter fermentans]AZR73406.1 ribonuclease J [Anoxybacter fermentans]
MSKTNEPQISIIPLGGRKEIGNNMIVIEDDENIIVLDSGIMFPQDDQYGVDLIMPDITYLIDNKDKILGFFISHGHEDHIGAIPYVLREINVPIYGTRLTLGLIQLKLKEFGLHHDAQLIELAPGEKITVGNFTVEFIHINHSIPDSVAMAIKTKVGTILYTGDYKFDHTPIDGKPANLQRLGEIGSEGVLALLGDSTNAEREGTTLSEQVVSKTIEDVFKLSNNRIIISTFSTNIHRIQQIFTAAWKTGRKVAITGRSMINVINIASQLGYLNIPEGTLIELRKTKSLKPNQIVLLMTGSQGEPTAALTRISRGDHRQIEIIPGDTVILSSMPIPGNERSISQTINHLYQQGAEVLYDGMIDAHASGHACQEELKLMINLIRPKFLIPVHGEYRHLYHHAKLAEQVGIPKENIFITDNGVRLNLTSDRCWVAGSVPSGEVMIDGLGIGDVGNIVLKERKMLSENGIVIVSLTIDGKKAKVLAGPDIISRGFVYIRKSKELIEEAQDLAREALKELEAKNITDWSAIKKAVIDSIDNYLFQKTRRKPLILPVIMEI